MEQKIGNIFGFTGGNYAGNVYDKDHLSPTLNTMQGGCKQPMIIDSTIVAMRGRNPTNPSDRTPGIDLEQTLEVNQNGTSNCLTSVQKDNLVMEKVVIDDTYANRQPIVYEDYSPALRSEREGLKTIEQDICRIEKEPCVVQKCGDRDKDGKYSIHSYSNCIPANPMSDRGQFLFEPQYHIRKLTPLECWRLMDFSDEDFEKAAEVNSNTQLYKQAGNSIVVNVLVAILGQLLQGKEDLYKEIS